MFPSDSGVARGVPAPGVVVFLPVTHARAAHIGKSDDSLFDKTDWEFLAGKTDNDGEGDFIPMAQGGQFSAVIVHVVAVKQSNRGCARRGCDVKIEICCLCDGTHVSCGFGNFSVLSSQM